jgi:hypothetical protein
MATTMSVTATLTGFVPLASGLNRAPSYLAVSPGPLQM